MEFICWVDRCMFPVDLVNDLVELGFDEGKAMFYEVDWIAQNQEDHQFKISRLYQNYCVGKHTSTVEGSVGFYLKKWLEDRYVTWQGYKNER